MLGTWVTYVTLSLNETTIDDESASTDWTEVQKAALRKNRKMTLGVYLPLGGLFLQLISNFMPSNQ
jgi:hypothetical protein